MKDECDENREHIDLKDVFQIAAGALGAAILFGPNQDLHNIAYNLPFYKVILIFLLSLAVSGIIAYKIGARNLNVDQMQTVGNVIPVRVIAIYFISAFCCLFVLWIYNIVTINSDINNVINLVVVLSLIACGSGSMVDLAYSKNK